MDRTWDTAPLTLADLCKAISDGRVPYTVRDGHYELAVRDVRQFQDVRQLLRVDAARSPQIIPPECLYQTEGLDTCGLA